MAGSESVHSAEHVDQGRAGSERSQEEVDTAAALREEFRAEITRLDRMVRELADRVEAGEPLPPFTPSHPAFDWMQAHPDEVALHRGKYIAVHPEKGIVGVARRGVEASEILVGHRAALAILAAVGEVAVWDVVAAARIARGVEVVVPGAGH